MAKTPEPLAISVMEAAQLLGLSRNGAYEAVKRGELPTIRIGHRVLVSKPALVRMMEQAAPKAREPEAA
jgi:excisionase family DNA binding protein